MGRYETADAVYDELSAVFGAVLGNHDRLQQIWKADSVFSFRLTEPDATITCSAKAGMQPAVTTGDSAAPADLVYAMPADVAYGLLAGELSPPATLASGQVALQGPVPKLLQVLEGLVGATGVEASEPGTEEAAEAETEADVEPESADPEASEESAEPDEPEASDDPEAPETP